jgi:hypothetical protein
VITMPRGAPIPYPLDHAFCLMARLHPKVKPYIVLETAAGFFKMPGLLGSLTGILAFAYGLQAWLIGALAFVGTSIGYFMAVYAIYPPGFLKAARIYSLLTGYGIVSVVVSGVGLWKVGLVPTLVYWLSRLAAELVSMSHARRMGRRYMELVVPELASLPRVEAMVEATGLVPDGFALRCFGNAYATYAVECDAPLTAWATQEELESRKWRAVLKEFYEEWPQITRRFQVTGDEWEYVLSFE